MQFPNITPRITPPITAPTPAEKKQEQLQKILLNGVQNRANFFHCIQNNKQRTLNFGSFGSASLNLMKISSHT